jgi:hypothetical protein
MKMVRKTTKKTVPEIYNKYSVLNEMLFDEVEDAPTL